MPRDIILTGVPRSGTTLACHLLNQLPDVAALHEPIPAETQLQLTTPAAVARAAGAMFKDSRRSLLRRGVAVSRHVNGTIPDSHVPQAQAPGELRRDPASWGELSLDKPLTRHFILVVKHPVLFTAALESLTAKWPTFAIVRNPLAVLGSWNSVDMSFRTGRAPGGERIDRQLARELEAIQEDTARVLHLLNWFYGRFERFLPPERTLRYEDVVATNGRALAAIAPPAAALRAPLASRNASSAYDAARLLPLGRRLLETEGPCWNFYTRQEVETLLLELEKQAAAPEAV